MNYTVEELLAMDAAVKKNQEPVDWAAMYKEVTGKELIYIPLEDAPAELKAAMHYFAQKGEI